MVSVLEIYKPCFDLLNRLKIIWSENLSLNDREVNLNLIQPTGMYRKVNGNDIRPSFCQSFNAGLPSMRGAIINDEKHTFRRMIRFLCHKVCYQVVEGYFTRPVLTTAKDFCMTNIPRCQIDQSTTPFVLVLYAHGLTRSRTISFMFTDSRLYTRLLIGGNDKFIGLQSFSLPYTLVKIQNAGCLGLKILITWINPTSVLPGFDSIFTQPSPDGSSTNFGYDAFVHRLTCDFLGAESRQRNAPLRWEFTGQSLDVNDDLRGKKRVDARFLVLLPVQEVASQKTFSAICRRFHDGYQAVGLSVYSPSLRRQVGQFWRERLENTATYIFWQYFRVLFALHLLTRSDMGLFLAYWSPF